MKMNSKYPLLINIISVDGLLCTSDVKETTQWVDGLGNSILSLLEALHNQELPPTKAIGEMCAKVLTSLNDVSKKTQVLDDVSRNLMGISRDLETTILFASAGTLNSDENASFTGKLFFSFFLISIKISS